MFKLFGHRKSGKRVRSSGKSQRNKFQFRPRLESLERRELMAADLSVSASDRARSIQESMTIAADVSGDGRTDRVQLLTDATRGLIAQVELANAVGARSKIIETVLGDGPGVLANAVKTGDLNADGRVDLIFTFYQSNGTHVRTALGKADGTFARTVDTTLGDGNGVFQRPVLVGDVNNDGRTDLVFTFFSVKEGVHARTAFGKADGRFAATVDTVLGDGDVAFQQQTVLADVNGDGRDDLVFLYHDSKTGTHTKTALAETNGKFKKTIDTSLGDGNGVFQQRVLVADVNGDKRDDLVFSFHNATTGAHVRTALGAANGSFARTTETVLGDGKTVFGLPTQLRDLNADGRPDLKFSWQDSNGNVQSRFAMGLGNGKFASTVTSDAIVSLSGGRAAAIVKGVSNSGLYVFSAGKWTASSLQGVKSIHQLDNGQAAILLTNTPPKNITRSAGAAVAATQNLVLFDGVTSKTLATNVDRVIGLGQKNAYVFTTTAGAGFHLSPTGVVASAYSGTQKIKAIVAAGGGVVTWFSGGRAYFSPDGQSLGGGGATVTAYSGTQTITSLRNLGYGVLTTFSGGGTYYSPDGKNIGGGGATFRVTPLGGSSYLTVKGNTTYDFDGTRLRPLTRDVKIPSGQGLGLTDGGTLVEYVEDLGGEALDWIENKLDELAEEEMQKFAEELQQQVADVVFKEQSDKQAVRAGILASDGGGWIAAYGSEFNDKDYGALTAAIAGSVSTGNPGLLLEYFDYLIEQNVKALKKSLPDVGEQLLRDEFTKALTSSAFKNDWKSVGDLIANTNIEMKVGIATYHNTGNGLATGGQTVKWLNHYQPYVAFRFINPATKEIIQPTGEALQRPPVVSGDQIIKVDLYVVMLANKGDHAKTVSFRWYEGGEYQTFRMAPGQVITLAMKPVPFGKAVRPQATVSYGYPTPDGHYADILEDTIALDYSRQSYSFSKKNDSRIINGPVGQSMRDVFSPQFVGAEVADPNSRIVWIV